MPHQVAAMGSLGALFGYCSRLVELISFMVVPFLNLN